MACVWGYTCAGACVCGSMRVWAGCIPEDGLLDEQDVAARLLDLLHQVEDVGPLLPQDPVHLGVVRHHDLVVHLYTDTK